MQSGVVEVRKDWQDACTQPCNQEEVQREPCSWDNKWVILNEDHYYRCKNKIATTDNTFECECKPDKTQEQCHTHQHVIPFRAADEIPVREWCTYADQRDEIQEIKRTSTPVTDADKRKVDQDCKKWDCIGSQLKHFIITTIG
jgi:hypothetical protein